ncbi:TetR/AcrR family transcriptional regulator [Fictibacillus gelatini]|uniref:TetR/AcrR family transcriptional regulator n=1 Tax=Fictibacillus gelatini TaxID=225985 RepID=UPI0004197693|nr:TetR/AcrR family transcriptional regulator [Fictibacillus gelatini]
MSKEKIKEVALSVFASQGYEGASLSKIADGVGIKTPSIYSHFKSKEDLFFSIFEDVLWEDIQRVQTLLETIKNDSIEEKLYQILHNIFQYYKQNEEKAVLLKRTMLFPPDALKEELRLKFVNSETALSKILYSVFEEGIKTGVIKGEIEDLLASFYCLIDGLFIQIFYYGKEEVEARFQKVWSIFWAGIQA